MPDQAPDIALIHDGGPGIGQVSAPLAGCFAIRTGTLEECAQGRRPTADLYLYFTNPRSLDDYETLKQAIANCPGARILVFPTFSSDHITRLDHLEIDEHVTLPIEPAEFRALVKRTLNRRVERLWSSLAPERRNALVTSLECFETCFSRLQNGEPLPIEDIETSCRHIREAAALGDLDQWIDVLDRHHNYSFRHSMFVCGTLTIFAHGIGIRGADLELLTIGGLIHDIGKSSIPTAVLDKPGKLDASEWELMKRHPDFSREILQREGALDKIVLSMAVAHHEKLDGSGYPLGLVGSRIDDYVRMTAIADVYSALIDKRAYKGAMSSEEALALMETSRGHLDMDLLRAFKGFVLDQQGPKLGLPKAASG